MGSRIRSKVAATGAAIVMIGGGVGLAAPAQAADYPPTPQKVTCSAKAVNSASRIKVNMGPNLPGSLNYTFRIERRTSAGWARFLQDFKTKGAGETRTVNVPRGTYRVKCYNIGFPQIAGTLFDTNSSRVKIRR
jgi:hypothetical protein